MKDCENQVLAVANSIWVHLNTENYRPLKIPDDVGYTLEPPYPMEYADRKIDTPSTLIPHKAFEVKKHNIDSYKHVNNGQYIKMAEEYLPDQFCITAMRAEYKSQAVLGDIIYPYVSVNETTYTIILANEQQKIYASVEFKGQPINQ